MYKHLLLLLVVFLFTISSSIAQAQTITKCFPVVKAQIISKTKEQQLIDLINKYRVQNKLKPLKENAELSKYGHKYCVEMATSDFFSHTSPVSGDLYNRVEKNFPKKWRLAGENLGMLCTDPKVLLEAFEKSYSHNQNLLTQQYTSIGVGHYVFNCIDYWAVELAWY
jgi:uncharacterized protein YkwD